MVEVFFVLFVSQPHVASSLQMYLVRSYLIPINAKCPRAFIILPHWCHPPKLLRLHLLGTNRMAATSNLELSVENPLGNATSDIRHIDTKSIAAHIKIIN
ncbi:hypothetical protein F4803DRAFT_544171, partial [Xylaria telfairii]